MAITGTRLPVMRHMMRAIPVKSTYARRRSFGLGLRGVMAWRRSRLLTNRNPHRRIPSFKRHPVESNSQIGRDGSLPPTRLRLGASDAHVLHDCIADVLSDRIANATHPASHRSVCYPPTGRIPEPGAQYALGVEPTPCSLFFIIAPYAACMPTCFSGP